MTMTTDDQGATPQPRNGLSMQRTVTLVGAAVLLLAGAGLAIAAGGPPRGAKRASSAIVTQLPVADIASPDESVTPVPAQTSQPLRPLKKMKPDGGRSGSGAGAGLTDPGSGAGGGTSRSIESRSSDDDDDREVVKPSIREEDGDDEEEEEDKDDD